MSYLTLIRSVGPLLFYICSGLRLEILSNIIFFLQEVLIPGSKTIIYIEDYNPVR